MGAQLVLLEESANGDCWTHTCLSVYGGPGFNNRLWRMGGKSLAQVQVRENESLDSALKRFKKELQQAGVLKEARAHEHYEKPSDKKRRAEAARRRKMMRSSSR